MHGALLTLIAAALAPAGWIQAAPPPIVVSVAASLGDVMTELTTRYAVTTGQEVRLNVAGSNVAARQIAEGAPVDVFVSADAAQMDVAKRAGRLVKGSRVELLTNQLVVVGAPGSTLRVTGPASLGAADVRRVALGNPDSVPAGVYARQWLEKAGAWAAVSGKVVPTVTVRAALAAVRSGRADAGRGLPHRRPQRAGCAGALHRAARRRAAGRLPGRRGRGTAPGRGPALPRLPARGRGRRGVRRRRFRPRWSVGRAADRAHRPMNQSFTGIAAFSIATAALAMLLALPIALAIGWLLARTAFRGKAVVETLVSLPLVLPPVAIGLLLLQLLGRNRPLGRLLDGAGIEVVFTWKAVVLAMVVMSLPLMVMTIRAGFDHVDQRFERMAATLGAGAVRVFATITLPLARRSVMAAALLGFARALGEFGATIVVAGGIPGQTQTLAVAIFNLSEAGRESDASLLMLVSIAIAFGVLSLANATLRKGGRP